MIELKKTKLTESFNELESFLLLHLNNLKPSLYVISIISFFILFFVTRYVMTLPDDKKNKLKNNKLYLIIYILLGFVFIIGTLIFLVDGWLFVWNNLNRWIKLILALIVLPIYLIRLYDENNEIDFLRFKNFIPYKKKLGKLILSIFFFLHGCFLNIESFYNSIILKLRSKKESNE